MSQLFRNPRRAFAIAAQAAVLTLWAPAILLAQAGRVSGTITIAGGSSPAQGALVSVQGTPLSTQTSVAGTYTISGIAPGTYQVRVQRLGSKVKLVAGVVVKAGEETRVDAGLDAAVQQLGGVVVSASRRIEKITEAPATVTRFDASQIEMTIGNSFAPALKEAKGLDFVQVGITAVAVNARGFNSSFNNRMLLMEDGRLAVLPENGLAAGPFTTIPKLDLAGIEVLVGPGAALYGPDASNGVITLSTKDPKEYRGMSAEVSGGSQGFMDAQVRYAGLNGRWGYKVAAEYQSANDYGPYNRYAPIAGVAAIDTGNGGADFKTNVMRGSGSVVWYSDAGRLEFTAGASKSNGIGQTSVGRNQLVDWQYRVLQAKWTSPRWFAQLYRTQSLSGDTYQLNGFSQNRLRYPTISIDSMKHLSDFPADGRLLAAEVQNNFTISMLGQTGADAIDNTRIVWGIQSRKDNVSSMQQWLSDRNTGQELEIAQTGVYTQIETPLSKMLRLVLAGRYDKHDKYEAQFSPKAALLLTPWEDQTFRVSFNRAFKSPSVLQTDFYFPNFSPSVGVFGNQDGFTIKSSPGGVTTLVLDPIKPEINNTWELGYKAIINEKLYFDIAAYSTRYENFLSPLIVIANPFAGAAATKAYNTKTGAEAGGTGANQIALTYVNLGDATLSGIDLGWRYLITNKIATSGTATFMKLDNLNAPSGAFTAAGIEATSFNSPVTKVTAGMDFTDIAPHAVFGFTGRFVQGYNFRSGVNVGSIPTFGTIDVMYSWKTPMEGVRLTAQVQNLFTCVGGEFVQAVFLSSANKSRNTDDNKCGVNQSHIEMINMPAVGTMAFVGVRIDR